MVDLGNMLRVAFTEASDGPRIMMFGPRDVELDSLAALFRSLSQEAMFVRLEDLPWVRSFGGLGIELISGESRAGLKSVDGERHQYSWKLTHEDCLELAELVDGVIAAEHPCHQYLSQQYCDDATVVVSKGEYGDDVVA